MRRRRPLAPPAAAMLIILAAEWPGVRQVAAGDVPEGRCAEVGRALAVADAEAFDAALKLEGCSEEASFTIATTSDPKALPLLLRATAFTSPAARWSAIHAVAQMLHAMREPERGRWIAIAMPAFLSGLADPDPKVRVAAAVAFMMLGNEGAVGVPALARALEDPSREVRERVITALIALGSRARAAGPALLKARLAPLPPYAGDSSSLSDENIKGALEAAIAATGAGKDDARLAAEDEIRAAVVARVVAQLGSERDGSPRRFVVTVLREMSPPGLVAALARRGLAPSAGGFGLRFRELAWDGGDLAGVDVLVQRGMLMGSSVSRHTVLRKDGVWTVIDSRTTAID